MRVPQPQGQSKAANHGTEPSPIKYKHLASRLSGKSLVVLVAYASRGRRRSMNDHHARFTMLMADCIGH